MINFAEIDPKDIVKTLRAERDRILERNLKFAPERTLARDRRLAAVHEAGHAAMAGHVGFRVVDVHIKPSGHSPLDLCNKSWVGRITLDQNGCSNRALAKKWRWVALAGAVAEHAWKYNERVGYDEVEDPAFMSLSDWHMAGSTPAALTGELLDDLDSVCDLLGREGRLWPHLLLISRQLITAASRPSDSGEASRLHLPKVGGASGQS
ncbi:hypothetical protein [Bradyrhizobium genosp. P]|uniref:hypothetical protein n=1 Tax=Bradyrhizobium genosp. P TaxID=83641 RepID=UPI003CECC1E1